MANLLPRVPCPEERPLPVKPRRTMPNILVVDDDPAFVAALMELLTDAGYATTVATDGDEALQTLGTTLPIDGAIVDLAMPRVGGFQVIQQARTSLPMLAITGAYGDQYLEVAEYLGAKSSVRKPLPGASLAPIVTALTAILRA